jgi:hypothetical protein
VIVRLDVTYHVELPDWYATEGNYLDEWRDQLSATLFDELEYRRTFGELAVMSITAKPL